MKLINFFPNTGCLVVVSSTNVGGSRYPTDFPSSPVSIIKSNHEVTIHPVLQALNIPGHLITPLNGFPKLLMLPTIVLYDSATGGTHFLL